VKRLQWVVCLVIAVGLSACATKLPPLKKIDREVWLEQNWDSESRRWYHHVTQGTATLVVPFEWFMALEQPKLSLFSAPQLFSDSQYLQRFGFMPSKKDRFNRAGLPVGFAIDLGFVNPINKERYNAIGLTCSACHSGQITYKGTAVRYDGGPAMTNLTALIETLGLAMAYTDYVPFRFNRFAKRVLGENYSSETKAALKEKFDDVIAALKEEKAEDDKFKEKNVEEGFARIDALNRIGNEVFGAMYKAENNAAITAPVNYPYIWTSSWFDWVQYDSSIMQPMIRNAGEALGVAAPVNLVSSGEDKFSSSARISHLDKLEKLLSGANPRTSEKFDGLRAPKWPAEILGKIDEEKRSRGEKLYNDLCKGCHLPATDSKEFWDAKYWTAPLENGMRFLKVHNVPIEKIGTDPAQAEVILNRKVNTEGLGLDAKVCVCQGDSCSEIEVKDDKAASFALSLGVVVEKTVNHWYDKNNVTPMERERMNGYRPNCLQAAPAYKARPLNGIWATAPYLHNGSVPTLYALLSPQTERPAKFTLGNTEFDPVNVGYESGELAGAFVLDTTKPGNRNIGHEFVDYDGDLPGIIGRGLSPGERTALVEYLKTL